MKYPHKDSLFYEYFYTFLNCESLVVEDEDHFIFQCSLYKYIRDIFLHHVGSTVLNINKMNEADTIKVFISKQFVSYFTKIM